MFDKRTVYVEDVAVHYKAKFYLWSIILGIFVSFFFSVFGVGLAVFITFFDGKRKVDEWVGITPAQRALIDSNDALVRANRLRDERAAKGDKAAIEALRIAGQNRYYPH